MAKPLGTSGERLAPLQPQVGPLMPNAAKALEGLRIQAPSIWTEVSLGGLFSSLPNLRVQWAGVGKCYTEGWLEADPSLLRFPTDRRFLKEPRRLSCSQGSASSPGSTTPSGGSLGTSQTRGTSLQRRRKGSTGAGAPR